MSTETYTNERVKVSTSFKTTLPKAARQRLGASVGDEICFKIKADGEVVVEKVEQE